MQQTSTTWKNLWASGNARLEAKAVINGVEYTQITAPVITRGMMQGALAVGNVASACCALSVRAASASIPRSASVAVQMRLVSGSTASEWLPAGTYYISRRTRDPINGILSLECFDALLKANAAWTPSAGSWPRQMSAVAAELAGVLGLQQDSRNVIATGAAYVMDEPAAGTAVRDALASIAAANGGSWIVTPAGELRLVPLIGAGTATDTVVVSGITGGIDVGDGSTVTGVRYQDGDDVVLVGDATGAVVDAAVDAPLALALSERLIGLAHQPFTLSGAIYDPAAELGDGVRAGAGGEVTSVLYSEVITLGPAPRGEIGAPEAADLSDEYPWISGTSRTLSLARAYAREAVQALDDSLDQDGVFNRLTHNGLVQGLYMLNGQLYVNATYIKSGTLVLGGANNGNGTLRVLNSANQEVGTWDNTGISLARGSLRFPVSGGYGQDDFIELNKDSMHPLKLRYTTYNGALSEITLNPTGIISTERVNENDRSNLAATYLAITSNSSAIPQIQIRDNVNSRRTELTGDGLRLYLNEQLYAYLTHSSNTLYTSGNLTVKGTKSRQVETDQYSQRLLYCYETPTPLFGDVGEGEIGEDGLCYVALDPVFAQTIAANRYQVFLQPYGEGDCRVRERAPGWFVVAGAPGLAFGWELKARQLGYDQRRLDRADADFTIPRQSYGEDAAAYLSTLRQGRIGGSRE